MSEKECDASFFVCVLSALGYSHHFVLKCILFTVYYILIFCVLMAVFFTCELDVVTDTEFEDHNRKLSLQKLPRIKTMIECVSRAILF